MRRTSDLSLSRNNQTGHIAQKTSEPKTQVKSGQSTDKQPI